MKKNIEIPSLEKQSQKTDGMTAADQIDSFGDCDQIPDSWKPFQKGYVAPSPSEIRKTFADFSSSELANMLGLSDGRIIRRWKSGENEIPYAAWRLFLIMTERVVL